MAICLGLPEWASTRKAEPFWILLKQEIVSGSGISSAVCKSAPRSRQITTPAPRHSSFLLQAGCPSCCPTNSVTALKAVIGKIKVLHIMHMLLPSVLLHSVLWCYWLGDRKGIQPVKTEWWDAGMVMCLSQGADLHMAQLMPLPLTISCSSKSRLVLPSWFYLSGANLPNLSRTKSNRAVKQLCV